VSEHRYAFNVAVVGDRDLMPAEELRELLNVLVNRHRGERRITLILTGISPEGAEAWAKDNSFGIQLVPGTDGPVRQDCELIVQSHAIVVLGDVKPWTRLLALAREAYKSRASASVIWW